VYGEVRVAELGLLAAEGVVVRHYLEPSAVWAKRFVDKLPPGNHGKTVARVPLKIRSVGNVCSLLGDQAGRDLAHALWDNRIPLQAKQQKNASCRLPPSLKLKSGDGSDPPSRTIVHFGNFALVGDARYGGALPAIIHRLDQKICITVL
jgi:hypothetical protein